LSISVAKCPNKAREVINTKRTRSSKKRLETITTIEMKSSRKMCKLTESTLASQTMMRPIEMRSTRFSSEPVLINTFSTEVRAISFSSRTNKQKAVEIDTLVEIPSTQTT